MKSLKDTVLEAISSRRNIKEFPKDNTDKQGIIDWLEYSGYDLVSPSRFQRPKETLESHHSKTGNDCYMLGEFNSTGSSWIRIYHDNKVFFIRTTGDDLVCLEKWNVDVNLTMEEIENYLIS